MQTINILFSNNLIKSLRKIQIIVENKTLSIINKFVAADEISRKKAARGKKNKLI